ncbi:MAG: hypothetical protein AAFX94_23170, partial [Myxococcota bacterium]
MRSHHNINESVLRTRTHLRECIIERNSLSIASKDDATPTVYQLQHDAIGVGRFGRPTSIHRKNLRLGRATGQSSGHARSILDSTANAFPDKTRTDFEIELEFGKLSVSRGAGLERIRVEKIERWGGTRARLLSWRVDESGVSSDPSGGSPLVPGI